MKIAIADIKFDERGLVPAIVQDANTLEVLTLAYMNAGVSDERWKPMKRGFGPALARVYGTRVRPPVISSE